MLSAQASFDFNPELRRWDSFSGVFGYQVSFSCDNIFMKRASCAMILFHSCPQLRQKKHGIKFQVKLRRLIEWWRPSPSDTASLTLTSSQTLVRFIIEDNAKMFVVESKHIHKKNLLSFEDKFVVLKAIIFFRICCILCYIYNVYVRHVLRAFLRHHHVEHKSSQPECQGKASAPRNDRRAVR